MTQPGPWGPASHRVRGGEVEPSLNRAKRTTTEPEDEPPTGKGTPTGNHGWTRTSLGPCGAWPLPPPARNWHPSPSHPCPLCHPGRCHPTGVTQGAATHGAATPRVNRGHRPCHPGQCHHLCHTHTHPHPHTGGDHPRHGGPRVVRTSGRGWRVARPLPAPVNWWGGRGGGGVRRSWVALNSGWQAQAGTG